MDYEPFTIEVTEGEQPYEDGPITKVDPQEDGWYVTCDGWTCFVPQLPVIQYGKTLRESIEPQVGDRLRLYGSFGRTIEGIQINEAVVFYRTPEMREAHRRRYLENYKAEQERQFILLREQMDATYATLPSVFQQRIDRFRQEDSEFRKESERYEVFCCTEAVKIAEHLLQGAEGDAERALEAWEAMVTQTKPEGSIDPCWGQLTEARVVSEDHSNNTFGGALSLAKAYLTHLAGEPGRV